MSLALLVSCVALGSRIIFDLGFGLAQSIFLSYLYSSAVLSHCTFESFLVFYCSSTLPDLPFMIKISRLCEVLRHSHLWPSTQCQLLSSSPRSFAYPRWIMDSRNTIQCDLNKIESTFSKSEYFGHNLRILPVLYYNLQLSQTNLVSRHLCASYTYCDLVEAQIHFTRLDAQA